MAALTQSPTDSRASRARREYTIGGVVQGVGFRPFVHRLATRHQLDGWVLNSAGTVVVQVEGAPQQLALFRQALHDEAPELSDIAQLQEVDIPCEATRGFAIRDSESGSVASSPRAPLPPPIPPDVAMCDACDAELRDPADRRFRYPFINCTACGPRFTIVEALPYDRANTTMHRFAMCDACSAEYHDPANRRFHAEPIACSMCGPHVWLEGSGADVKTDSIAKSDDAVLRAIDALADGAIVAIKGVGGFHLACRADDEPAVQRLRERKARAHKPFAVMVRSVEMARELCFVNSVQESLLSSSARPIVLLTRRETPNATGIAAPELAAAPTTVARSVAPAVGVLGLMLPYTPLHALLAEAMPLVLTSGNLSDEPIAISNADARARLANIADYFLMHDRDIASACDDSVLRVVTGVPVAVRRSRGYAPLALPLAGNGSGLRASGVHAKGVPANDGLVSGVLATGADLKAAACVAVGDRAVMSQHIGDQGSLETQAAFAQALTQLCDATAVSPSAIACDAHPGYHSTAWATREAREREVPLLRVQHHHAHIVSVLAEHGMPAEQPVIGVAFDGTGYGPDGAIWGGELLVANAYGFSRAAHLGYVSLPGGDAAVRRPNRMALAHLRAAGEPWHAELPCVQATPATEQRVLASRLESGAGCVPTSSAGRLLDAMASVLGVRQQVSYEGQAAMELEALAATYSNDPRSLANPELALAPLRLSAPSDAAAPLVLDVAAAWPALARAVLEGQEQSLLAWRAHATVVQAIVQGCVAVQRDSRLATVALSGGVFQNALLLAGCQHALEQHGFTVMMHRTVPPNDGGIALGQAVVAQAALQQREVQTRAFRERESQSTGLPEQAAHFADSFSLPVYTPEWSL